MIWRLTEDHQGLPAGACVSEAKYQRVYYLDKSLFEPIGKFEEKDMIEYEDNDYCCDLGIEKLLFYSEVELQKFVDKYIENDLTE